MYTLYVHMCMYEYMHIHIWIYREVAYERGLYLCDALYGRQLFQDIYMSVYVYIYMYTYIHVYT